MCNILVKHYRICFLLAVTVVSLSSIILQTSGSFSSSLDVGDTKLGYVLQFPYLPNPSLLVELDEGDDVQISPPDGLAETALIMFIFICIDIILTPVLVFSCLSVALAWMILVFFSVIIASLSVAQCVLVSKLGGTWTDAIPYMAADTSVESGGMVTAVLIVILQMIVLLCKIAFYLYVRITKILSSYHFEE